MEYKEIIDNLTHDGAFYRWRAILYAISDDPYALELVNGLVDFKFEKLLNLDIP